MYIQRSVQNDGFILLKRQESFYYDSSDTSLPDLSANGKPPTGEDNGVTIGIVRFCIVLGGILFVIIITGIITYIYRKKLLKSKPKPRRKVPKTNTISYILDYYEHDYVNPIKDSGITVMKVNKSDISTPMNEEDIQTSSKTNSQISAPMLSASVQISGPMPNASVSIYNKERANSLARSVENMNTTTITPPVPALTSIDDKELKSISRNTSKGSEIINPISGGSKILRSTSKESGTLRSTSKGSTSKESEMLKYTLRGSTSRESELLSRLSKTTSFDSILPEIFDDSSETAAPIDINAKWFTYPIDSPTIPLSPSRVPKGSGNNDERSSDDESVINDIAEVYDRKSKRNLRIRIDTFDQFNNINEDKSYTPSVTFTPKSESKKDDKDDKNKSIKVDTNKIIQDVQGSDKYRSFGVTSTKNNQHKRNGSIFEHKYLIRSKTIT